MQIFNRHKTSVEIKKQCEEQGLEFNTRLYDMGGDHIIVRSPGAYVIYNVVNGRFHGATPHGVEFSSDGTVHDSADWFKALLNFFYTNDPL